MAEQQKEEAQVTKLLVLGTGESGKSTIFKQMKILYAVPDPPSKYIPVCRANLIGNAHMVHGKAACSGGPRGGGAALPPPPPTHPGTDTPWHCTALRTREKPETEGEATVQLRPPGPNVPTPTQNSDPAAFQAAWRYSAFSSPRQRARRHPKRLRVSRLTATLSARCDRILHIPPLPPPPPCSAWARSLRLLGARLAAPWWFRTPHPNPPNSPGALGEARGLTQQALPPNRHDPTHMLVPGV